MSTKIFNVSLPVEMLRLIDSQAKLRYETRSAYVKGALLDRLKAEGALIVPSVSLIQAPKSNTQKLKNYMEEWKAEQGVPDPWT